MAVASNKNRASVKLKQISSTSKEIESTNGSCNTGNIIEKVYETYQEYVQTVESKVKYLEGAMKESYFTSVPVILVIGNYSSGKTSFIKYLLQQTHGSMNIGPQPTTDVCNIYAYGETETTLTGRLALTNNKYPFGPLEKFGDEFISRFNLHEIRNPLLKGIILFDTPGILSGDSSGRGFNFTDVIHEVAKIVHKIIVMIDPFKVDVSDPMKDIIRPLSKKYHNKILTVINKAHTLSLSDCIDIFTGIAWHFSKAIDTPEMMKFYICSFINPLPRESELYDLIKKDMDKFVKKFSDIAKSNIINTINNTLDRIRNIRSFIILCNDIGSKLPLMFKDGQKKKVISELSDTIKQLSNEKGIAISEFPKEDALKQFILSTQLGTLCVLKPKYMENLETAEKILMALLEKSKKSIYADKSETLAYKSKTENNPFINQEKTFEDLITQAYTDEIKLQFSELEDLSITNFVKYFEQKTEIDQNGMAKIWDICASIRDPDNESIDLKTFCIMFYFAKLVNKDIELPKQVPKYWIKLLN